MSAADRSHQISQLATWACEGKLTSAIDSIFPIEQIDETLRRSEQSGRLGKVIVHPNMQPLTNPKAP